MFAQFGPPTNLGTGRTDGNVHVFSADLDNDGDMDVLSASTNDDKIAWYENLGNDQYSLQKVISTEADEAMYVSASDLDNDGDMDVLSASAWDHKVAWYENDGSGNFGAQIVLSTQVNGAYIAISSDLDADGDLDVIAVSNFTNKVSWFENLGNGVFNTIAHLVANTHSAPYSIAIDDLDGDADPDILVGNTNDEALVWYPNDGTGNFGSGFLLYDSTLVNNFVSVCTQDLDNDGDKDILRADYTGFFLYENLGAGTFSLSQDFDIPYNYFAVKIHCSDTDEDGDSDILVSLGNNLSMPGHFLLYENNGNLTFSNPDTVFVSGNAPEDIVTADLDGDGSLDIIGGYPGIVRRLLNLGQNTFSGSRILNTYASFSPEVVKVVDMDNDGDMDIAQNGFNLVWYPNEGGGTFGTLRYIKEHQSTDAMAIGDINNDGYPDVLNGSYEKLSWFGSLGNGTHGSEQFIDSLGPIVGIQIGDLDGDGDNDVVCTIDGSGKFKWFENQNMGSSWQVHILGNTVYSPTMVIADLDNNGSNDILVTNSGSGTPLNWFKNNGNGSFTAAAMLDNSIQSIETISVSDLNNDGLTDILYCYDYNKFGWKRNLGNGAFGPAKLISAMQTFTKLITVDVDNDNDQDIVVSASWGSRIAWFENDGSGNFALMDEIYDNFYAVGAIAAGDLTGDSYPDLVSSPGILWFENLGLNPEESHPICPDSLQFQLVNDTICLAQPLSGSITLVADSGYYMWNLGNIQYMYGTSFSWASNATGIFDLGISLIQESCINDTVIKVYVESCLSLEEHEHEHELISIYPNPAKTEITVSITSDLQREYLIELEDLLGKKILQQSLFYQSNLTIPVSDQSPGIYLLSITNMETGVEQIHQLVVE